MKNLIKNYFVFMSQAPVLFSLMPICFLFLYALLSKNYEFNFFTNFYWLLPVLFVNICLTYFVKYKYITEYEGDYRTMFQIIVTKEGKKIFSKNGGSVWAKGKVYRIYDIDSIYDILDKRQQKTETSCYLKGNAQYGFLITGRYKNSLVEVPAIINLCYDGFIDLVNLSELLIKNNESESSNDGDELLCIHSYLREVFKKANKKHQVKFNEIISRYAQTMISDSQFLSELIELVEFPERIFPCVTDTKICLGTPQASACKGMMC